MKWRTFQQAREPPVQSQQVRPASPRASASWLKGGNHLHRGAVKVNSAEYLHASVMTATENTYWVKYITVNSKQGPQLHSEQQKQK